MIARDFSLIFLASKKLISSRGGNWDNPIEQNLVADNLLGRFSVGSSAHSAAIPLKFPFDPTEGPNGE
jgi:hypothetical protein